MLWSIQWFMPFDEKSKLFYKYKEINGFYAIQVRAIGLENFPSNQCNFV